MQFDSIHTVIMSSLETFLQHTHLVIVLAADAVILSFSLIAYRRTKLRVFAFLMIASALSIIQSVGVETYDSSRLSVAEYERFMVVWRISYIATVILSATGTVMLIRYVLSRATQKDAT